MEGIVNGMVDKSKKKTKRVWVRTALHLSLYDLFVFENP